MRRCRVYVSLGSEMGPHLPKVGIVVAVLGAPNPAHAAHAAQGFAESPLTNALVLLDGRDGITPTHLE